MGYGNDSHAKSTARGIHRKKKNYLTAYWNNNDTQRNEKK